MNSIGDFCPARPVHVLLMLEAALLLAVALMLTVVLVLVLVPVVSLVSARARAIAQLH